MAVQVTGGNCTVRPHGPPALDCWAKLRNDHTLCCVALPLINAGACSKLLREVGGARFHTVATTGQESVKCSHRVDNLTNP